MAPAPDSERAFVVEQNDTISGSADGNTWKTHGTTGNQRSIGGDVVDVTLPIEGAYRFVRLTIGPRDAGESFELCEVEIWGE